MSTDDRARITAKLSRAREHVATLEDVLSGARTRVAQLEAQLDAFDAPASRPTPAPEDLPPSEP